MTKYDSVYYVLDGKAHHQGASASEPTDKDDGWYFWDAAGWDHGPFSTRLDAHSALDVYAEKYYG